MALARSLGDHPNTAEIATWLARLTATMAPETVDSHRQNLCAVYTAAHLSGLTSVHPCARDLRWPRPKPQPRALSPGVDARFASVLDGLPPRQALFLGLCRWAGLRRGEALAVTAVDILATGEIRIERERPNANSWTTTPPKTCQVRTLPIRDRLQDLLASVLGVGAATVRAGRGGGHRVEVPFLCPLRNQDIYAPSDLRARLTALDPEHLGRGDAYHVLRHTFAAELLDARVDMREIRDLLGHDSVAHTERYCLQLRGRRIRADVFATVENNGRLAASKYERTDHAKNQPPAPPFAP